MPRRFPLWIALLLLAAGPGLAQETPPKGFSEVIEVRVVEVDVVVTDGSGKPLTDLKREDFELFVDKKPVEISNFARVVDGSLQIPATGDPAAAATPTPAEAAAIRTPVTWVVFVDQTNMHPSRRNEALRQLLLFMQEGMKAGDRALVASNDGVAFRIRQSLSDDWKLLLGTMDRLRKERVNLAPTLTQKSQILNEIHNADRSDREFRYVGENLGIRISRIIDEEFQRTGNAIRSMGALLEGLDDVDGRVAILYVGSGFNTIPALELTEAWRYRFADGISAIQVEFPVGVQPEDYQPRLESEIRRLLGRISATRVTLYTLHPGDAGISAEGPSHLASIVAVNSGDRSQLTEMGLARDMAERTGGRFYRINPGLARQLETVRRDMSNYYSLGFVPTGPPGISRDVRVKVNVPGARVLHRDAVRERTPQEREADAVVATLIKGPALKAAPPLPTKEAEVESIPSSANPLGITVQADRPRRGGAGGDYIVPFRVNLRLEDLTFWSTGKSQRAALLFHFALIGPDGTTWQLETREQMLEIPDAQLAVDTEDSFTTHAWHLNLAPLRVPAHIPVTTPGMRLTLTVEDRVTQVRSVIPVLLPNRGTR